MTPIIFGLGLPFVSAGLNQSWRGSDGSPKWAWFAFMTIMGFCLTQDIYFTAAWLLLLVGYAVPPTHGMFSAITGRPPGRKDSKPFQWAQNCTAAVSKRLGAVPVEVYWHRYGIIYGAFRSLWMLPGLAMMTGYTGSTVPAYVGSAFFLIGLFYYMAGEVPWAERTTGFLLGVWLLASAWCL